MERLCVLCSEACLDKPTDHYNTLSELQSSATSCPLCAAILRTMEANPPLFNNNIAGAPGEITSFKVDDVRPKGQAVKYMNDLRQYGILARSVWCHTGRFQEVVSEFLVKNDGKTPEHVSEKKESLDLALLAKALLYFSNVGEHRSHALEKYQQHELDNKPQRGEPPESRPRANLDGLLSRAIWAPTIDRPQIESSRLDLIKSWIDDCHNKHPMCRSTKVHRKPTRLIDVWPGGRSDIVQLVDTTNLSNAEEAIYTTLSHCWGADSRYHFTTTSHTEASRRQAVDYAILPKTYQDAVSISRRLGVKYIWIDSLCIIQDDFADWQRESSHMAAVFQGSYFTIAATSATDAREGCYLDSLEPPMRVERGEGGDPVYIRCPGSHVSALHYSPLNSRAWVLQELILSPRTVHFTSEQLYWQCRELYFSEDGLFESERFASIRAMYQKPLSPLTIDHEELGHIWWSWVRDYTSRRLTKPGDWLAATAGITQYFQDHTTWAPCLGLWRESLVTGLCWHINSGRGRPTARHLPHKPLRTTIKYVPTWSWFSFFQTPTYQLIGSDQHILSQDFEILELDIAWVTLPLISQLQSSSLVIKGQVQYLEFQAPAVPAGDNSSGVDRDDFIVDGIWDPNTWTLVGQKKLSCARCYLDEEIQLPKDSRSFFAPCLLLCYSNEKDPEIMPGINTADLLGTDTSHLGHFLILRHINAKSPGIAQYERIGIGSFDLNSKRPDPFQNTTRSIIELI